MFGDRILLQFEYSCSLSYPHSHTHTLIITLHCACYDVIYGAQDGKMMCFHADSLTLTLSLVPNLEAFMTYLFVCCVLHIVLCCVLSVLCCVLHAVLCAFAADLFAQVTVSWSSRRWSSCCSSSLKSPQFQMISSRNTLRSLTQTSMAK